MGLDEIGNPFVIDFILPFDAQAFGIDLKTFLSAVQNNVHGFLRNLFNSIGKVKIVALGYGLQLFKGPRLFVFPERSQSAGFDGYFFVGDDFVLIYLIHMTQSTAFGAHSLG